MKTCHGPVLVHCRATQRNQIMTEESIFQQHRCSCRTPILAQKDFQVMLQVPDRTTMEDSPMMISWIIQSWYQYGLSMKSLGASQYPVPRYAGLSRSSLSSSVPEPALPYWDSSSISSIALPLALSSSPIQATRRHAFL